MAIASDFLEQPCLAFYVPLCVTLRASLVLPIIIEFLLLSHGLSQPLKEKRYPFTRYSR